MMGDGRNGRHADTETNMSAEAISEEGVGEESCQELKNSPMDVVHAKHEALALQYKARRWLR